MKSIRVSEVGPPQVMKLQEVPDPVPQAGQIVVKVAAIGVNPVETYVRAGKYPLKASLPYTPGHDAAGTVFAVGEDVKGFRIGDRVYTSSTISGAYAEKVLCPEQGVHPLSKNVTFQQGAAMGVPYATAWRALHLRGRGMPGEWMLVHGATGGVGTATVQLGRAWGMHIIATGGTERGRQMVKEQGADHVLDHHAAEYLKHAMELTGGHGVDIIVEFLANVNLNKDLGILSHRGRVVVVGSRGPVEIDARQTMTRDASILGMSLNNATPTELREIHAALVAGLADGSLRPVIGREFALADAAEAHEAIMSAGAFGKIVLIP